MMAECQILGIIIIIMTVTKALCDTVELMWMQVCVSLLLDKTACVHVYASVCIFVYMFVCLLWSAYLWGTSQTIFKEP